MARRGKSPPEPAVFFLPVAGYSLLYLPESHRIVSRISLPEPSLPEDRPPPRPDADPAPQEDW